MIYVENWTILKKKQTVSIKMHSLILIHIMWYTCLPIQNVILVKANLYLSRRLTVWLF